MKDLINKQLECLSHYKHFNREQAMKLNTGDMSSFYDKLVDYEKKLSKAQCEAVADVLLKRYGYEFDDTWGKIEVELEEEGLI